MPLKKSSSKEAFKQNVKTEIAHGKPAKQAFAIAYSMKRKAAKSGYSDGGSVNVPKQGTAMEQLKRVKKTTPWG